MITSGLKVVIDTNVFITIVSKKSPHRWIFDRILKGEFILCISNEILLEYQEVFSSSTNAQVAQNIVDFLVVHPSVNLTWVHFNWDLIKNDFDDNKFVDCAVSSDAYCILTNDKHFNEVKEISFPKVKILSLTEFAKKFKPKRPSNPPE